MKFSVQNKSDISKIPSDAEAVHLVRPLSYNTISELLARCKSLKQISMSASTQRRLSKKTKKMLEDKGISAAIVAERGRAIAIPLSKMKHAIEMRQDHRPLREIAQVTGIPKSTVHYLEKYSKRRKIKKGNAVIYLK